MGSLSLCWPLLLTAIGAPTLPTHVEIKGVMSSPDVLSLAKNKSAARVDFTFSE